MTLPYIPMLVVAFFMGTSFGALVATNASRMKAGDRSRIGDGVARCDQCDHILKLLDTIPIVSFIWLRGRCRHCQKPIPRYNLWAEILGGVGFVFAVSLFTSLSSTWF